MFKKKKKKIRQELDILCPPKNSSFQGKFLGIKLSNMSSISLVFTIYKFTAKLKHIERQGLGGVKEKDSSKVRFSSLQFSVFHLFCSFLKTEIELLEGDVKNLLLPQ